DSTLLGLYFDGDWIKGRLGPQCFAKVAPIYFRFQPQHSLATSVESVHNRIAGEAARDKPFRGTNPGLAPETARRNEGVMGNMRNWILGAAVVAGVAGLGATTAQAAEFGYRVRGPVAYVPPCPGPGYVWTAGYMANGYWVPGFWNFVGYRDRGYVVRYD